MSRTHHASRDERRTERARIERDRTREAIESGRAELRAESRALRHSLEIERHLNRPHERG